MAIIARDTQRKFTPPPEGLHQAVCVDVVDLGLLETPWGPKQKVEIRWQLEVANPETGHRHLAVKRYTLSLNEKATLRQHLEAWRGRKFTQEELQGFDLEKLLGVNGQVQIVHILSDDGRTFGNVQAIVPLGKGMVKMRPEEYIRMKDRQPEGAQDSGGDDDEPVPF